MVVKPVIKLSSSRNNHNHNETTRTNTTRTATTTQASRRHRSSDNFDAGIRSSFVSSSTSRDNGFPNSVKKVNYADEWKSDGNSSWQNNNRKNKRVSSLCYDQPTEQPRRLDAYQNTTIHPTILL